MAVALASAIRADDKPPEKVAPKSTASPAPAASPAAPATPPAKPAEKLPKTTGSHLADDANACIQCHTTADVWDPKDKERYRFYLPMEKLKKDVHYSHGVNCSDCHGGNAEVAEVNQAHATEDYFRKKLPEIIAARCTHCHDKAVVALNGSVHANADKSDDPKQRTFLSCVECHGQVIDGRKSLTHSLLPHTDLQSPVHLDNQVKQCGGCHEKEEQTYLESIHGVALTKLGLNVGPVCADCHSAHDIYHATDKRSTLNVTHVADTCGKCHRGIEQQLLQSVHGRGGVLGGQADRAAPGGTKKQLPSCTDCHPRHEIRTPDSVAFREALPGRCGNCHGSMSNLYALSMHGKLTRLGYAPAAKCGDCHGSHHILPTDDPRSQLSPANRAHTCGQCHVNAHGNFVNFNPHLDPFDGKKNRLVNGVQVTLLTLLFTTFAFFGVHCVLWFVRGLVEVFQHGRPHGLRPGGTAYVRFISFHRIGHTVMMTAFLGLALTGLPLKYSAAPWAKWLADRVGGFDATSFWHRFFGVILMVMMLVYLARLTRLLIQGRARGQSLTGLIFGPESPVPNLRDLKDFLKMMRWFFGLGPKPSLDRWSYWEKIDFWGAIADTVIIGTTGLVLWFPNFFAGTLRLPGTTLNLAAVIHSTQALLATGFVFAIHFFNTHIRPDKFPADMSVLTGLVSEEEFKEERPDYFRRLQQEGKLDAMRTVSPGLFALTFIRLFGFVALLLGLALLVGMIVASLG